MFYSVRTNYYYMDEKSQNEIEISFYLLSSNTLSFHVLLPIKLF